MTRGGPRTLAAVAAGGFIGGLGRYALALGLLHDNGSWPWATLAVNLAGAFALALLLTVTDRRFPAVEHPDAPTVVALLGSGLIGGFTTFSAWMVEVDTTVRASAPLLAASYLAATLLGGLAAAVAGAGAGRALTDRLPTRTPPAPPTRSPS